MPTKHTFLKQFRFNIITKILSAVFNKQKVAL